MDETCAASLAGDHGAITFTDWSSAVRAADVDLVIMSTTHDVLSAVSVNALQAGCHVLCEKPLGRDRDEVARSVDAAAAADRVLRADPAISGGGELLDQGAHLLDLSRWLLDDFESALAHTQTAFWDMPVEDNAFVLLLTAAGQVASLHVSWTQWRNLFSLEVFGRDGYAIAEGLGGGGRTGRNGSPTANAGPKGMCPRRRVRFSKRRMARGTWNGLPSAVEGGGQPRC